MRDSAHGTPLTVIEPPPRKPIRATRFVWRDPATIPRREWLYARHYVRKYISLTIAPSGVGKSTLSIAEFLAMVTGRPLLGVHPDARLRIWYLNLEDPAEEIERRIAAACLHFGIGPAELEGRLFIDSGRDTPVVVATETKDGAKIVHPVVDDLKAEIARNEIDLLIIDPFVSSHAISENDNNKISVVKDVFAGIADEMNVGVELVHHTRKGAAGSSGEHTVDDGRGASALLAGARSARVLNGMTKEQAEKAGVDNPRLFFTVSNGKSSMAPPPDKADWFQIASVSLENGGPGHFDQPDHVGVVTEWQWPDVLAEVTVSHLRETQRIVAAGEWREAVQSKDKWVGAAVAQAMKLDWQNKAHRTTINAALGTWYATGMLIKVRRTDSHRDERTFVEVGEWASD